MKPLVRECLAEFLGTFILMVFGTGVGAQFVLSRGEFATAVSNSATWGIGVMMGIYVSGGVSGGHINPAVSIAMAMLGRLPWYKVPFYYVAQCAGSFAACCCSFLTYWDTLDAFDGGDRQVTGENGTAGIFATYPQHYVSVWTTLGDQIFSTGVLMICVLAITDPHNMRPPSGLMPVSIGLLVMALSMSYSLNCGNAMNPARDFIPRIFTVMAGWDLAPLSYRKYNYFWVNIFGPHIGAVLGSYTYQLFIGYHWPPSTSNVDSIEDNHDANKVADPSDKATVKDDSGAIEKPTALEKEGHVNKGFEVS
ncbi:aquaporin-9-like [Babylonia areolata]|uniref:aquaporin-9-like n=1 Tax=Babylonia areolata TaxID=304850 RepID=UPI003FD67124